MNFKELKNFYQTNQLQTDEVKVVNEYIANAVLSFNPSTVFEFGCNNGKNGGRICWVVAGTFCDGKVQGIFAQKYRKCLKCVFLSNVIEEDSFIFKPELHL